MMQTAGVGPGDYGSVLGLQDGSVGVGMCPSSPLFEGKHLLSNASADQLGVSSGTGTASNWFSSPLSLFFPDGRLRCSSTGTPPWADSSSLRADYWWGPPGSASVAPPLSSSLSHTAGVYPSHSAFINGSNSSTSITEGSTCTGSGTCLFPDYYGGTTTSYGPTAQYAGGLYEQQHGRVLLATQEFFSDGPAGHGGATAPGHTGAVGSVALGSPETPLCGCPLLDSGLPSVIEDTRTLRQKESSPFSQLSSNFSYLMPGEFGSLASSTGEPSLYRSPQDARQEDIRSFRNQAELSQDVLSKEEALSLHHDEMQCVKLEPPAEDGSSGSDSRKGTSSLSQRYIDEDLLSGSHPSGSSVFSLPDRQEPSGLTSAIESGESSRKIGLESAPPVHYLTQGVTSVTPPQIVASFPSSFWTGSPRTSSGYGTLLPPSGGPAALPPYAPSLLAYGKSVVPCSPLTFYTDGAGASSATDTTHEPGAVSQRSPGLRRIGDHSDGAFFKNRVSGRGGAADSPAVGSSSSFTGRSAPVGNRSPPPPPCEGLTRSSCGVGRIVTSYPPVTDNQHNDDVTDAALGPPPLRGKQELVPEKSAETSRLLLPPSPAAVQRGSPVILPDAGVDDRRSNSAIKKRGACSALRETPPSQRPADFCKRLHVQDCPKTEIESSLSPSSSFCWCCPQEQLPLKAEHNGNGIPIIASTQESQDGSHAIPPFFASWRSLTCNEKGDEDFLCPGITGAASGRAVTAVAMNTALASSRDTAVSSQPYGAIASASFSSSSEDDDVVFEECVAPPLINGGNTHGAAPTNTSTTQGVVTPVVPHSSAVVNSKASVSPLSSSVAVVPFGSCTSQRQPLQALPPPSFYPSCPPLVKTVRAVCGSRPVAIVQSHPVSAPDKGEILESSASDTHRSSSPLTHCLQVPEPTVPTANRELTQSTLDTEKSKNDDVSVPVPAVAAPTAAIPQQNEEASAHSSVFLLPWSPPPGPRSTAIVLSRAPVETEECDPAVIAHQHTSSKVWLSQSSECGASTERPKVENVGSLDSPAVLACREDEKKSTVSNMGGDSVASLPARPPPTSPLPTVFPNQSSNLEKARQASPEKRLSGKESSASIACEERSTVKNESNSRTADAFSFETPSDAVVEGFVAVPLALGLIQIFDGIFLDEQRLKRRQLEVLLTRFFPAAKTPDENGCPKAVTASNASHTIEPTPALPDLGPTDTFGSTTGPTLCVAGSVAPVVAETHNAVTRVYGSLLKRMLGTALDVYARSWAELSRSQSEMIKELKSQKPLRCEDTTAIIVRCTATFCAALDHFILDWLSQLEFQSNVFAIPLAKQAVYRKLLGGYFEPDILVRRHHRVQTIGGLFKSLPSLILKRPDFLTSETAPTDIPSSSSSSPPSLRSREPSEFSGPPEAQSSNAGVDGSLTSSTCVSRRTTVPDGDFWGLSGVPSPTTVVDGRSPVAVYSNSLSLASSTGQADALEQQE